MSTRTIFVAGVVGIAGFAAAVIGVIAGVLAVEAALVTIATSLAVYVGALITGALAARGSSGIPCREAVARRPARLPPPERWERRAILH
ncbi:MAG: hypothetical protein IT379_41930 [Deltaproteobacteria bacterium]|nr:hypothetical protein [Deltaproteobacteria bacterium]